MKKKIKRIIMFVMFLILNPNLTGFENLLGFLEIVL